MLPQNNFVEQLSS